MSFAATLKHFKTLIETLEVGNYQAQTFMWLRDVNYHSNFRVYLGRDLKKNPHVSYLLRTTEMPRGMDRPFLRTPLKLLAVWHNTIPKKPLPCSILPRRSSIFQVTA